MAFLVWKDQYSVKINSIDDQHKKIINMINDLVYAIKSDNTSSEIANTTDRLIDYAIVHFQMEEDLMKRYGYPDYSEHKKEHVKLSQQVEQIRERIMKDDMDADELLRFLMEWLVGHIMKEDKKYSHFLIPRGAE